MSIYKYYEVRCDKCNNIINIYHNYKPNIKQLRKDCGKVRINNGKPIIICKDCCEIEEIVKTLEEDKNKRIKNGETISSNLNDMIEMYKSGIKCKDNKENI